jgi:chitin disaccharide deacetylase
MLIVNADDWGRSPAETDAALQCYRHGRITSASAMVFMSDSERAAELAKENGLDVGLHLNFAEEFTGDSVSGRLQSYHASITSFLMRNKYSHLLYNPVLRNGFSYSYKAQAEEFERLFGRSPSHVDGHHHMHLCGNVLLSRLIPAGTKMRRNFSFWPGEKSLLNRGYRALVDRWLARKYYLPDYFFDLTQCIEEAKLDRVAGLARSSNVELMTHPIVGSETDYLMGDEFAAMLREVETGTFVNIGLRSDQSARPAFAGSLVI